MGTCDPGGQRSLSALAIDFQSMRIPFARNINGPCAPEAKPICRLVMDARLSSVFFSVFFFDKEAITWTLPSALAIKQVSSRLPKSDLPASSIRQKADSSSVESPALPRLWYANVVAARQ